MNKLFTKIATAFVGMAMAVGVGVAVGAKPVANASSVHAADGDTHSINDFTGKDVGVVINNGTTPEAITVADQGYTVKQVIIGWRHNKANDGVTATVTVGGSSLGSGTVGGQKTTSTTTIGDGTASLSGAVNITWTNGMTGTGKGTLYIESLTLVEGSGGTEDVLDSISVSGSLTKTVYYVGEAWDPAGLVVTANYESGAHTDVTSAVSWTYNPASASSTSISSVVATASYGGKSSSSSAQSVSVTKANPIQVLYTKASGASVDVYGYYVGFLDGTGPVIMDGEYGIVVYNKTADVSGYTVNETILYVTGSISIFNGLYEIGSSAISEASSVPEENVPATPVVYATKGGETADYASRLTTVTGTPTVTSGSFDNAAGTSDIKMNFDLGASKTVQVFYKKAAQTADADAFAAIKAAVTDSTEITIKGFTGWYNGFQVQMNGYIPPAEGYTAEVFAQDLLDQTDAICENYDDVTNNHDAIEAIWSNLASNDKYPSLPSAEKTILAEAARDESGTVVEQAMARYDYLTGKYNLSNFINGRTPVSFEAHITTISSEANTTNAMIIVTVIALTSVSAIAVLLVIKRRKTY